MAGEEEDDVQPDSPPGFVNEIDNNELEVIEVRFNYMASSWKFIIHTQTSSLTLLDYCN